MMLNCLCVGIGGFAGAVLRYLIGLIPVKETMIFPIKTFAVNILGCFLIGCISAAAVRNAETPLNPRLIFLLKTGVCGGFTTFSSFALETTGLMRDGHWKTALFYAVLSVIAGVGAAFAPEMLTGR